MTTPSLVERLQALKARLKLKMPGEFQTLSTETALEIELALGEAAQALVSAQTETGRLHEDIQSWFEAYGKLLMRQAPSA